MKTWLQKLPLGRRFTIAPDGDKRWVGKLDGVRFVSGNYLEVRREIVRRAHLLAAKIQDAESREVHGNTGKRNAAKDNPKSERIVVRVTPEQKASYTKRAKKARLTLSRWIESRLEDDA